MTEERSASSFGEVGAPADRLKAPQFFILIGYLMVPVCVLGLFWQQSFIWAACPQALGVMFVGQWQHAYDSLGAASILDLAVAVLYYPLIGRILSRAVRRGRLAPVALKIVVWHVLAIGLAVGVGAIRNQLWSF